MARTPSTPRLTPIRLALLENGRTGRWLAEQLGVSEVLVSRIVNGHLPDDEKIALICAALDRPQSVLFPHLSAASDHTTVSATAPQLGQAA